jgi:cobaltochelatase CobN
LFVLIPVITKRQTLAQVLICLGCCCGRTDRGKPAVPVDWLKAQWKQHKLLKSVQLTISGCLGPCDVANVVSIVTPWQTIWLGKLTEHAQYQALFHWAQACATVNDVLPLPDELRPYQFDRFSLPVTQAVGVAAD